MPYATCSGCHYRENGTWGVSENLKRVSKLFIDSPLTERRDAKAQRKFIEHGKHRINESFRFFRAFRVRKKKKEADVSDVSDLLAWARD